MNNLRLLAAILLAAACFGVTEASRSGSRSLLQSSASPPDGYTYYTVRQGDTLPGIAQKFGSTTQAILAVNPSIVSSSLPEGQVIRLIPGTISPASAPSPSSSSPPPGAASPTGASDFTVGFTGTPPISPPPPPAAATPPSAPPPASNNASSAASSGSSTTSSSGSSGISGGAVAGIAIGALAGVALLAFLAFFLIRRRRRRRGAESLPSKIDPAAAPQNGGTAAGGLGEKPRNFATNAAATDNGLSWKEGDELKRGSTVADAIRSTNQPPASVMLPDKTSVIVERGPGGSVRIARAPASSTNNSSNTSSQAVSIESKATSGVSLPQLPWSDWQIKADDIIMAKDETGAPLKLGSGAYGTVFMAAIDGVTQVAVKIFHDVHSSVQQADILREVAILKSCRDRNIVQFLGACIMDERIMLVTEFMEAGDLWHALVQYQSSGALSWYKRGKNIALDIARGLHYLHKHKIIHFDLKSANVLLTKDGLAKISDVGFANILDNTHLSNNVAAFTFAWAAPEVLMGAACTEKADIFSYGVVLWELVTGQQPKRGQLRDCKVPDECPAEVEALIQRCLSFQPEERPSCKDIVDVLSGGQFDQRGSTVATTATDSAPNSSKSP